MSKISEFKTDKECKTALIKTLRTLGMRHGLWQVFRDMVAMSAIAISNAVDKRNFEVREAEYMKIVGKYTKDEANSLSHCFALIVMALDLGGFQDFMGELFMELELGDSWKGQYFSPFHLCSAMARMTMQDAEKIINEKGYVSLADPCIGGGAMVIAAAESLQLQGINYQQTMFVSAQDIDIVAVHMSYIQLSLFHIPAIVYHGNSLSGEIWSQWVTPAYILGDWNAKMTMADHFEKFVKAVRSSERTEAMDSEELAEEIDTVAELYLSAFDPEPAPTPAAVSVPEAPKVEVLDVNLRSQLSLF